MLYIEVFVAHVIIFFRSPTFWDTATEFDQDQIWISIVIVLQKSYFTFSFAYYSVYLFSGLNRGVGCVLCMVTWSKMLWTCVSVSVTGRLRNWAKSSKPRRSPCSFLALLASSSSAFSVVSALCLLMHKNITPCINRTVVHTVHDTCQNLDRSQINTGDKKSPALSEFLVVPLCPHPPASRCQYFFIWLNRSTKGKSHPLPTQSDQLVQSPFTYPRRHTSRLNSSRLLWSNMRSSPCERLISRSSKDRSVSGRSSALWGERQRVMRTYA